MLKGSEELFRVYGRNVRVARKRKGLTLQQLSEACGYNREDLSTLENGEHDIYMMNAIKIAEALNIDFPLLFSRRFLNENKEDLPFRSDDFLSIFANNVKRLLKSKHLNQASLQVEDNLDASTISRILSHSNNNPKVTTLQRMAKPLNEDLVSLLRRK